MRPERLFLTVTLLKSASIGFTLSTYALFLESIGLTKQDILLVNVCFFASVFLFEIPTGALADGRGRRWSVRAGSLMHSAGVIVYATAGSVPQAVLAEIVVGIGNAFHSGAFSAWLYDGLDHHDRDRAFKRTTFRAAAINAICFLVCGALGSQIASHFGYRAIWFIAAFFDVLALIVTSLWMGRDGEVPHHERVREFEAVRLAWMGLRSSSRLRWGSTITIMYAFVLPFNYFWQSFFTEFIAPSDLGWIWIVIYSGMAFPSLLIRSSHFASLNEENVLVFCLGTAGATLLLLARAEFLMIALCCTFGHELTRGLYAPLLGTYFQKQFERRTRAVSGSIQSFISTCANTIVLFTVWIVIRGLSSDIQLVRSTWTVCGSLLFVASFGLLVTRPKS